MEHAFFLKEAIRIAREGMQKNMGGPFGAVVVKDGRIIGSGCNRVAIDKDPTAHAEIVAIRDACRQLGHFQLDDCVLYTTCEPCPMCLGAIFWARPSCIYYAATREDAAKADFDDEFIYEQISLPAEQRKVPGIQILREEALGLFREWKQKGDKTVY
jgi:guanine deaminase